MVDFILLRDDRRKKDIKIQDRRKNELQNLQLVVIFGDFLICSQPGFSVLDKRIASWRVLRFNFDGKKR